MRVPDKVKNIANEIRKNLKHSGVKKGEVSVTCKMGTDCATIYIITLLDSPILERTVVSIYEWYKNNCESESVKFMYQSVRYAFVIF